jgi:hypothetical protein
MNTDELVSVLARGAEAVDPHAPARRYLLAVALGTVASVLLTAALLGLRSTLVDDLAAPMFWAKELFCVALAAAGVLVVKRLARPGTKLGLAPLGIVLPVLALWLLASFALYTAEPGARAQLVLGHTARVCPFLIALVSAPLFVAFMWSLRDLAPTRLRLAGAAGGFGAGAMGALAYSLHCPELAAPFVGIWYMLGILIPTVVGIWVGPRLLRW